MSSSDDLFEKADALLGRYRGESRPAPDYPVLTEVVETVPAEDLPDAAQDDPDTPRAALPATEAGALTPSQLAEFEARLLERLERSISDIIEAALDERWHENVEEQVRTAIEHLTRDLKVELEARLQTQAVGIARSIMAEMQQPLRDD